MKVFALLALFAASCTTTPIAPVPPPLPAASAWKLPGADEAGAFLGLRVEANEGGSLESLAVEEGVRVVRVIENSPAAQQGVRQGDVLLRLDDTGVADAATLALLLERATPGEACRLAVRRDDTVFELEVTLAGELGALAPAPEEAYVVDPSRTRAGWASTSAGVKLAALAPDARLAELDVPLGSVLLSVDGEAVLSARGLVRRLQDRDPGTRVTLRLRQPDGRERELELPLHSSPTRVTRSGIPVLYGYEAEADGSSVDFSLLDLWFFELFQYHRREAEREWILLELFGWDLFPFSTGVGELTD